VRNAPSLLASVVHEKTMAAEAIATNNERDIVAIFMRHYSPFGYEQNRLGEPIA